MTHEDTSERQVNIPLLRKAVEWAEAEAAKPEIDCEWSQSAWRTSPYHRAWQMLDEGHGHDLDSAARAVSAHCGTAFCIAGWVAQSIEPEYARTNVFNGIALWNFAADQLGISSDDNYNSPLFDSKNTIADVRRIAEEIAGEAL